MPAAEELDDVERDDLAGVSSAGDGAVGAIAARCSERAAGRIDATSTPRPPVASATASATGVSR
jgi:hypothetical protein